MICSAGQHVYSRFKFLAFMNCYLEPHHLWYFTHEKKKWNSKENVKGYSNSLGLNGCYLKLYIRGTLIYRMNNWSLDESMIVPVGGEKHLLKLGCCCKNIVFTLNQYIPFLLLRKYTGSGTKRMISIHN